MVIIVTEILIFYPTRITNNTVWQFDSVVIQDNSLDANKVYKGRSCSRLFIATILTAY